MEIEIDLPVLHPGQVAAYKVPGRFKAVRCGRRWGKSVFAEVVASDDVLKGRSVGIFTPTYKQQSELFNDLAYILAPVRQSSSKVEGVFRTTTGGRIDFWTLEDERAGRSRKYHRVIVDEAAFTKPNMMDIWNKAIRPTLLDYAGSALVLSNTNGIDPTNFFWQICNEPKHGFVEYHAPSHTNPFLPREELEKLERESHPLVWQQEYMSLFVDFAGTPFFRPEWLLAPDGKPVDYPMGCDSVFAVIDTAVKQGLEHDGTAVSYWSLQSRPEPRLTCLDWDLVSVDGALLEHWIPDVFRRLEGLAKECRARLGSGGAYIEDAQSGAILLQQCANRGLPAEPLPSGLTAAGKDGRALNISGVVAQGRVKFSRHAYDKVETFKGHTRNHMWAQIVGFRIGDKAAATRADDLFDTFAYAAAVGLGNSDGFG